MNTENQDCCSICMDPLCDPVTLTKCNHGFHMKCLDKWTKTYSNCPLCRASITLNTSIRDIVMEMINRFEENLDWMEICQQACHYSFRDVVAYIDSEFITKLSYVLHKLDTIDLCEGQFRKVIYNIVFKILDDSGLIVGNMLTTFEKEFA